MLARWLIYFVASGQAYFAGGVALIVAIGLSSRVRTKPARISRNLLAIVGMIAALVSATPVGLVRGVAIVCFTGVWVAGEAFSRRVRHGTLRAIRSAAVLAWVAALAVELPYHLPARIPPVAEGPIAIVGDSITAGIDGPGAKTWPSILADRRAWDVRDFSRMGATTASALNQAAKIPTDARLVLVEIGGNDLLGNTTPEKFASDLDALLRAVECPGRTVVMFELPLPPFANRFGLAQRQLARTHGVILIPKRFLLGILQSGGATLDSIHLSPNGHEAMAGAVSDLIGPVGNRSRD